MRKLMRATSYAYTSMNLNSRCSIDASILAGSHQSNDSIYPTRSPGIAAHSSYAQPQHVFHTGAIKAIYSAIDFSKDGINEVVIGRDTGSLEVYGFDQQHQPALIFQASLEESISSIDGGFFTSPNVQVSHDCTATSLLCFVQCALSAAKRYVTG